MYPLENHLCNQLDLTLAFKIITLSLAESNRKDDDLLKVDGIKKMSTENLLEEKTRLEAELNRFTIKDELVPDNYKSEFPKYGLCGPGSPLAVLLPHCPLSGLIWPFLGR